MAERARQVSRLESEYYSHMGFDPEHQREVLRHYVPMFAGHGPVLELGCGRGEFLGLLREAGVDAQGVDEDAGMVERARAEGLAVLEGDAIEMLHAEPPPALYRGVFCAHFLEHLAPDQVTRLLAGVRRVLAPGGRFVAVTPNPACYAVLSHDFWRDPTHVRFYDVPLVEFFCRQAGFEVESSGTNPANHPGPPPEFLVREPIVHPGLGDLVEAAMRKMAAELERRGGADAVPTAAVEPAGERREVKAPAAEAQQAQEDQDSSWAYELAHVVSVLGDRLQETTEALRELRRAYDNLVWGLYQGNETYVVARG